jgi:DNA topoisomerase IB
MAYTDQAAALTGLKALNAVRDLPLPEDDEFLNSLLVASSAKVGAGGGTEGETTYPAGTLIYRHYYVAGRFLEILRSQQSLSAAPGGAKFTNLVRPIASLFALQQGMDAALNLEVPEGYEPIMASEAEQTRKTRYGVFIGSRSSDTSLLP